MDPVVYQGSASVPATAPRPVVTIGNFDGVHLGHAALLGRVVEVARALGAPACVYTFHPAPRDVLRPDNPIRRIQTLPDRIAALGHIGIERVVVEPFTRDFAALSPREFAEGILAGRLHARALVLGYDFRYGAGRAGTVDTLREWLDVPIEQVGSLSDAQDIVSSSRIRRAVEDGDVDAAAAMLGRPHEVVGTVVHGQARGRDLGFPTANVRCETPLIPGNGVYVVEADVGDGTWLPGVANVGRRPTFDGGEVRLEVHVLEFAGNLYGRTLRTRFLRRLRGERAFEGPEQLVAQIQHDIAAAWSHFRRGVE